MGAWPPQTFKYSVALKRQMALSALPIITDLSVLLLLGILGTLLARKLKISNVLILLVGGFVISKIALALGHADLFSLPEIFLVSLAIITLAVVVFEGTSRLSYRQLDTFSVPALTLTLWQMLFVAVAVGLAAYLVFFSGVPHGIILSLILAVAVAGTDPSSVLIMVRDATGKVVQLLTLEAIINTPVMVLIPFILLDTLTASFNPAQLLDILQQIIVGIGTGVVLGIIVSKALRRFYAQNINPVAVIAATLLSYILAENLHGSGVLAVATFGVLFGNFTIKRKEELQDFSFAFSNVLELLIFVLIGIIIGKDYPLTFGFFLQTFAVFVALVGARAVAVYLTFRKQYDAKEMLFAALTAPKGLAVAVLIFTFALYSQIPADMLYVLFAITVYSILLATVTGVWWAREQSKRIAQKEQEAIRKPVKRNEPRADTA